MSGLSLGLLFGAQPAVAADPSSPPQSEWETPQSLDDGGLRLDAVNQMTGDGTSVITWMDRSAAECGPWWTAVRRPGEASWGDSVRLGRDVAEAEVVVGGKRSVVAVLESCDGDISYRRLRTDGWSDARPVPTPGEGDVALDAADVNGQGALVVTYRSGDVVEGAVRPKHGRWSQLPTLTPGPHDFFPTLDVDSAGRVTYVLPERDSTWRDILSVAVFTLVDGDWDTERIEPPHGSVFSGLLTSSDERGSISVAALTREDAGHRAELWVSVRPRGTSELIAPAQLGDPAYDVVGVSGGLQRSGELVLAWAEERDEGERSPLISARHPRTGEFSPARSIGSPGQNAFPDADVARDGSVVIDIGPPDDKVVYVCDGPRRCGAVGSPIEEPMDRVDFEAGPERSVSVALTDEECGEQDCYYRDIRASYLAPPSGLRP